MKTVFQVLFVALLLSTTFTLSGQTSNCQISVRDSFYVFKQVLMRNRVGHPNIKVGVDSQNQNHDWLSDSSGSSLQMNWSGGEDWGAVFITSGIAKKDTPNCSDNNRDTLDLSMFNYLLIDMKGHAGDIVEVGIKDMCNRNNGEEVKIPVTATPNWNTYCFPLARFSTSDIHMIHLLVEFVFGPTPALIEVKNIRYVKGI